MIHNKTIVITGATSAVINKLINRLDPARNRISGVTSNLKHGLRDDISWVECDHSVPHVDYDFVKKKGNITSLKALILMCPVLERTLMKLPTT